MVSSFVLPVQVASDTELALNDRERLRSNKLHLHIQHMPKMLVIAIATIMAGCSSTPPVQTKSTYKPYKHTYNAQPHTNATQDDLDLESADSMEELLQATDMDAVEGDRLAVLRYGDLWKRIPVGFRMDLTVDNPRISAQRNWFVSRQPYLDRLSARASRYLYYTVTEAERRGIPTELALLPVIESSYDPFASSNASAAGMWQFIPSTGRIYGLRQDAYYDGRRDVMESTRAAYDFLTSLEQQFGSWELALAAYNAGAGRVQQAINRNIAQGLPTDYWSLRLPEETMNYVPRFIAVAQIIKNPASYGVQLNDIANRPHFRTVSLAGPVDLESVVQATGLTSKEVFELNPAFLQGVTSPTGPYRILIPNNLSFSVDAKLKALPLVDPSRFGYSADTPTGLLAMNTSPNTQTLTQTITRTVGGVSTTQAAAIMSSDGDSSSSGYSTTTSRVTPSASVSSANQNSNQGIPSSASALAAMANQASVPSAAKIANALANVNSGVASTASTAAGAAASTTTTVTTAVTALPTAHLTSAAAPSINSPAPTTTQITTITANNVPTVTGNTATSVIPSVSTPITSTAPSTTMTITRQPITAATADATTSSTSNSATTVNSLTTTTTTTGVTAPLNASPIVVAPAQAPNVTPIVALAIDSKAAPGVTPNTTPPTVTTTTQNTIVTDIKPVNSATTTVTDPLDGKIPLTAIQTQQTVLDKQGETKSLSFEQPYLKTPTTTDVKSHKLIPAESKVVADVQPEKPKGVRSIYIVKAGDTLSSVATKTGLAWREIAKWNQMDANANLITGTPLYLYGAKKIVEATPTSYMVQAGDTLTDVAAQFKLTPRELAERNNMKVTSNLITGTRLNLLARNNNDDSDSDSDSNDSSSKTNKRLSAQDASNTDDYKVRRGDTLAKVAGRYNLSVSALAKLNGIPANTPLQAGDTLSVPAADSSDDDSNKRSSTKSDQSKEEKVSTKEYKVHSGETLARIAAKHGLTVVALADLNDIPADTRIQAGDTISVPDSVKPKKKSNRP